MLQIIQR